MSTFRAAACKPVNRVKVWTKLYLRNGNIDLLSLRNNACAGPLGHSLDMIDPSPQAGTNLREILSRPDTRVWSKDLMQIFSLGLQNYYFDAGEPERNTMTAKKGCKPHLLVADSNTQDTYRSCGRARLHFGVVETLR